MNHHMAQSVDQLSFFSLYRPDLFILIALLGMMYYRYTGKQRVPYETTKLQKFFFTSGLIFLYIAKGSPMSIIGHHYLFSVHMVEMAISYLVVPPLLLLGTPHALFIRLFQKNNAVMKSVRFLTKPLIALLVFIPLFSIYHLPIVFDTIMKYGILAFVAHTVLFITAVTMWWPVLCPVQELAILTDLKKVFYVFGSGMLLTPACALIMFSKTVMYETYQHVPQLLAYLPPAEDQATGGIIMKVLQELIYGLILGRIFYQWVKRERAKDREELAAIQMKTKAGRI
ncbi:CtaG protein [Fictibacillus macauensis ZFHKF-1]|uniref:CtaG protein n=1 Tax=Fictibacillus macauensis ZFHKF-1 TaxID=1196324 RepID=I8UDP0_9BACL|nr:cytochrome c oxidase assembly protein [Fictibacillus macauensis]EIT84923.1 CtaG protein [Fictibacillus macauensis ZFHKF-1]